MVKSDRLPAVRESSGFCIESYRLFIFGSQQEYLCPDKSLNKYTTRHSMTKKVVQ